MTYISHYHAIYLLKLLGVGAVFYFDIISLFSLSFGVIQIPGT